LLDVRQAHGQAPSVELPCNELAPADARRYISSQWGHLPSDRLEVALLLTSELVTNAVCHAGGPAWLDIHVEEDVLTVGVTDEGEGEVRIPDEHRSLETHGRGLRLVDELSRRWGVHPVNGTGKRVWFELSL
jgi:anti-sigma regulatory factor (Ser/Thr protein kinase)